MSKADYYLFYLDKKLKLTPGSSYSLGRHPENSIKLENQMVSRHHALLTWRDGRFYITDLKSKNGLTINGHKTVDHDLHSRDKIQLGPYFLEFLIVAADEAPPAGLGPSDTLLLENKVEEILKGLDNQELAQKILGLKGFIHKSKAKLRSLAIEDSLTKLYNRHYFEQRLGDELGRCKRHGSVFCLIMIDIDHFKSVNDTYGHLKGDEVLYHTACIIRENTRAHDIVSRYGGEEIAVILIETRLPAAAQVAEKIRSAVAVQVAQKLGIKVTISLGLAQYAESFKTNKEIIAAADSALYRAKSAGRNRVVIAPSN